MFVSSFIHKASHMTIAGMSNGLVKTILSISIWRWLLTAGHSRWAVQMMIANRSRWFPMSYYGPATDSFDVTVFCDVAVRNFKLTIFLYLFEVFDRSSMLDANPSKVLNWKTRIKAKYNAKRSLVLQINKAQEWGYTSWCARGRAMHLLQAGCPASWRIWQVCEYAWEELPAMYIETGTS